MLEAKEKEQFALDPTDVFRGRLALRTYARVLHRLFGFEESQLLQGMGLREIGSSLAALGGGGDWLRAVPRSLSRWR